MATYNFRSGRAIISKVFRDMGIQRADFVNDAVEWIGEALELIGSPGETVDKVHITKTSSHRAPLPPDFYYPKSVRHGLGNADKTKDQLVLRDFNQFMEKGNADGHPAMIEEDKSFTDEAYVYSNETFLINGEYIQTSFESDWIAIFYRAFPIDDHGFPLVPDAATFSEALYWFIRMKLRGRGEQDPAGFNYGQLEERWLKYAGQAEAESKMPDIPDMASFREMWVRFVPKWDRDFHDLDENTLSLESLKEGLIETRPITVD